MTEISEINLEAETKDTTVSKVLVMFDTESLGLLPDSVMRSVSFIAVDSDDPETELRRVDEYLPLEIQEAIGRKTYVSTCVWLLDAPDEVKHSMRANLVGDLEELRAIVRSVTRKFEAVTHGRDYEVWFRRPQHDVPMLTSLWNMCGESIPWAYDRIMDLASVMDFHGLNYKSVTPPVGNIKHVSIHDVEFQLKCYVELLKQKGAK